MKPMFALFVLAALTPCLVSIERLAAASPDGACEAGCEKSCCMENGSETEKACCTNALDCEKCTAAAERSQSEAASSACKTSECSACERKTVTSSAGTSLKLFWTLPLSPAQGTGLSSASLPRPWIKTSCPSSPCADSACANTAITAGADSAATEPCCECDHEASTMRYAAIPAAVPSPFAKGAEYLSAPVLATQAYAATLPLQAPPAPLSPASGNLTAPSSSSCPNCVTGAVAPNPVACPTCVTPATKSRPQPEVTQVLFSVDVIEDSSNSLAEYESLQSEMPFLTAESEIVLATVRILEKQNLLRRLSNPRLITTVGRPAMLQIGSETPAENGGEAVFNGLRMEVAARELGGGLEIEFKFCDTTRNRCYQVATSLLVAHGQTVVMKTSHPKTKAAESANGDEEGPVYVVLTPQIVK